MELQLLRSKLKNGDFDKILTTLYVEESQVSTQTERYLTLLNHFREHYSASDVEIYSAPGRTEISGNHTDHQHGEVLAASINRDSVAVVAKTTFPLVRVISDGSTPIHIDLSHLEYCQEEESSTTALIKGSLFYLKEHGYQIGGFDAYITSNVLIGAGLSSSASFETLIGTIISGLYNNGSISPVEIAKMGQYAENVYFGKPCGLMDQMACSVGGLIHIDFHQVKQPEVEKIDFDFTSRQYRLCITNTLGSHADLTPEYAAIPKEMKDIAEYFHKDFLIDVTYEDILSNIRELRNHYGDRAVLRAIHFVNENVRVRNEVTALKDGDFDEFLTNVSASGKSSFCYLQNVYTSSDVTTQNMSLALAVSETVLGKRGVARVHGGGFAGTIEAFVPNELVPDYKRSLECLFGENCVDVLMIRNIGGTRVLS